MLWWGGGGSRAGSSLRGWRGGGGWRMGVGGGGVSAPARNLEKQEEGFVTWVEP